VSDLPDPLRGLRYPGARRVGSFEGGEQGSRHRFVLATSDSLAQVARFYRRRFPVRPTEDGPPERRELLFVAGEGEDRTSVRISPAGPEIELLDLPLGFKTIVVIRAVSRGLAPTPDDAPPQRLPPIPQRPVPVLPSGDGPAPMDPMP